MSQPIASLSTPIAEFSGAYRFLSNFYATEVVFEGLTYPSSEHAFQAAKTLSPAKREHICTLSASHAKAYGRGLLLRPDWESMREDVMRQVLAIKFSQPELRRKLLATGDAPLTEGNTWGDTYWGVDALRGGKNRLGVLLMELRDTLRKAGHASQ